MKGKNLLGQLVTLAHQKGLNVIIYYCTVYVDRFWEHHPDARIVDAEGIGDKLPVNNHGRGKRFSVLCMNNLAYRDLSSPS